MPPKAAAATPPAATATAKVTKKKAAKKAGGPAKTSAYNRFMWRSSASLPIPTVPSTSAVTSLTRTTSPSLFPLSQKTEIQRVKAASPDLDHKAAFTLAAKNWATSPDNPKAAK
ncbi:hypothetical protein BDK51DRAFT_46041 [Blyttiomyces helicus]|uniref:YABBY protein C-terminal domain-containing protein n=1 Tax=Blyttiomyces helicus TaxID=388810 RepID=A0A4P9WBR8_9FUNG|nr:hypothetical protein BDK51DRAFT_46041 [Blyttiomyces helicus]|eukprot:RKO88618.1 hypothetical protein BDK51DRAFT_46041 [Blyttiomyces helicus]